MLFSLMACATPFPLRFHPTVAGFSRGEGIVGLGDTTASDGDAIGILSVPRPCDSAERSGTRGRSVGELALLALVRYPTALCFLSGTPRHLEQARPPLPGKRGGAVFTPFSSVSIRLFRTLAARNHVVPAGWRTEWAGYRLKTEKTVETERQEVHR